MNKKCPKCNSDVQDIFDACQECGYNMEVIKVVTIDKSKEIKKK